MLGAYLVPRSNDPALEKRERTFNGVRMNFAVNVHARAVIHGLMIKAARRLFVCREVVCADNVNVLADVVLNECRERARRDIFGAEEIKVAVTLPDADNDF